MLRKSGFAVLMGLTLSTLVAGTADARPWHRHHHRHWHHHHWHHDNR